MCGIYMINNTVNGKPYIGQAKDIAHRWSTHRVELNAKRHANRHLQGAWNKYGAEAFVFSVLEECEETNLNEREKYYIEQYDAYENGYNMDQGGEGIVGFKHTEEEISKMRRVQNPLVILQFDFDFNLLRRFEGGSSHIRKELGYTKECVDRCCKHQGGQIYYKNSYWVYEKEYQHKDFSWDKYLKQIACCDVKKEKREFTQRRICQYDKQRNLIKIWNSFSEIEDAGYTRNQVNTICNRRKGKKTHKGYIWVYEDYDWSDGYFDNLDDAYAESIAQKRRAIRQIDKNGNCVCTYESVTWAADTMGIGYSCISRAATHHTMSCGYFWAYVGDDWFASQLDYLKNYQQGNQIKGVVQLDEHNKMITRYLSRSEAGRSVGASAGEISRAIKQHGLCRGFYWIESSKS